MTEEQLLRAGHESARVIHRVRGWILMGPRECRRVRGIRPDRRPGVHGSRGAGRCWRVRPLRDPVAFGHGYCVVCGAPPPIALSGTLRGLPSIPTVQLPLAPKFTGLPYSAVPYFFLEQTYDTTIARALLEPHGVRCPGFPDYARALANFVAAHPRLGQIQNREQ